MDERRVRELFELVRAGEVSPEEAVLRLKMEPFEELGYAKVDHHRGVRQGVQEVIFGQSKTPEQIAGIAEAMLNKGAEDILVTRVDAEAAVLVGERLGGLWEYHELPRLGIVNPAKEREERGNIVIASGGTSDMAVCEEAAWTAQVLGNRVQRLYDVGVAGLHRLLSRMDVLMQARVVIAVAGMEGALASVIGGLTDCPVIAVPTSVGYGASFHGVAALLSMLNSCASGVSVVNIDNGFGAGYLGSMINRM